VPFCGYIQFQVPFSRLGLQRMNIKFKITILCLSLLTAACGYRFAGSGSLPGEIQTLFIAMLENRTAETGMENTITNDLIYEFTKNSRIELTDHPAAAVASLSGVILSISNETVSRQGRYASQERRVKITVGLKLTDVNGTIIWTADSISENQEYEVAQGDKPATEQNKALAVSELSKRLAETIYNRMTDGF
jgi:outer membrane lipopolysaccharide assembly protein LptE/RlpB